MSNNNVTELKKPDTFANDSITEVLRQGARKLSAQALETVLEIFISQQEDYCPYFRVYFKSILLDFIMLGWCDPDKPDKNHKTR